MLAKIKPQLAPGIRISHRMGFKVDAGQSSFSEGVCRSGENVKYNIIPVFILFMIGMINQMQGRLIRLLWTFKSSSSNAHIVHGFQSLNGYVTAALIHMSV